MSFGVQSEKTKVEVNEAGITQSEGCEQGILGEGVHLPCLTWKTAQETLLQEGRRRPLTPSAPSASAPSQDLSVQFPGTGTALPFPDLPKCVHFWNKEVCLENLKSFSLIQITAHYLKHENQIWFWKAGSVLKETQW